MRTSRVAFVVLVCGAIAPVTAQGPGIDAELTRVRIARDRIMPSVERQILPVYPPDAAGARGAVDIEVVVGTRGRSIHTRVTSSADPTGVLDRAALEAVRSWEFRPATNPGSGPVPSLVLVRVEFDPARASGSPNVSAAMMRLQIEPLPAQGRPGAGRGAVSNPSAATSGFKNPRPIRHVLPSYTPAAMRAKVQGTVQLEILVTPDGTVGSTRIRRSLHEDLDREALIAARYWLFEPATRDGQPIPFTAVLELEFRLH
jgi:TonB family protein